MSVLQELDLEDADDSWSFKELNRSQTSYLTHDYHRYPAKFIPQLAERLIKENSKPGDLVCDPFMGSGTTLIESIINSRRAYGSDINPVSVLISKAKTTPIEPNYLKDQIATILMRIKADLVNSNTETGISEATDLSSVMPKNEKIDYWFFERQKRDLAIILSRINRITDYKIQTFMLCAFSNILKVCSRWMMKSIKPTVDNNKSIASAYRSFALQTKRMSIKNQDLWDRIGGKQIECVIENADARMINVQHESASTVVTSPPYVTSYEYSNLHQLTAIWLGYLDMSCDFRSKFIGSKLKGGPCSEVRSSLAKKIVLDLSLIDIREARTVKRYFSEMQKCFQEIHRILKKGGRTCIIIGDTQLRRVKIHNAHVFIELMNNLGFETHTVIKRLIPNKVLPLTRDEITGRFSTTCNANRLAYPSEYILIMEKL